MKTKDNHRGAKCQIRLNSSLKEFVIPCVGALVFWLIMRYLLYHTKYGGTVSDENLLKFLDETLFDLWPVFMLWVFAAIARPRLMRLMNLGASFVLIGVAYVAMIRPELKYYHGPQCFSQKALENLIRLADMCVLVITLLGLTMAALWGFLYYQRKKGSRPT